MTGNDKVPRSPGVVPLRTILRNFLNLVESCEAGSSDGNSTYEKEFQELKQFSENLKSDPAYLSKEGEKTANKKKNRYKDILPFDYTRVILCDYGDVPGSDYINANFIKGASGSSAYIACQGPLPHTVNDFWRMVVECEVQVIVMACNEQESGKHKCENYWVEEEDVERQFGQVTIWLKKCRQVCPDFLVRTMRIRYTTAKGEIEERNVCQFHYSAWPDHGVPTKVRPLLDMVRLIRDCQTSETLPVLVHCSAGCGRTGTICAIDYVWGLLRLGKLNADFSLFQLVQEMRRQRIAMVQTKDQYILVHRAVKELFEEQLKIIDSHPYANVDGFGLPIDIKKDLEEPTYETVEYNPNPCRTQYQTSTSVPPIPPPPMITVNSKILKESDNLSTKPQPGTSKLKPSKVDDITVLSDCEEVEKEKDKKTIRNGLLRKPSIVKLKSFFEKSKDSKKSGQGTSLSRAKSDVSSSRFYTFNNIASSIQSRINPSQKSPTPSFDASSSSTDIQKSKEKAPSKPPLLAKPLLPVKRSKSLKLGKADSFEKSVSLDPPVTSTSSISHVTNINPIKVCIKQVDIPELKKSVAKSVKPEIQTAMTHELNKQACDVNFTKPLVPPKNHIVKGHSFSHIKMGVAKEMEDAIDISRHKAQIDKLKKYDTVFIKSPKSKRTSLTRSQSHVWQPTKVQAPFRIFSNENIHQNVNANPDPLDGLFDQHNEREQQQQPTVSQSNGNISEKRTFGSFDAACSKLNSGITIGGILAEKKSLEDMPIVRRRVPKTNPYTNYTPAGMSHSSPIPSTTDPSPQSHQRSKSDSSRISTSTGSSSLFSNMASESKTPKDLPQLKPGYTQSRENSSESSSSNTATPRSSLPSTPTQTIDSTYAQIIRSNLHGVGVPKNVNRNVIPQTRSILKGSLSSTPSESDERLDSARQVSSSSSPSHTIKPMQSVITPPQKINTVRIAMRGIRERRNSFRQAVCKEEQTNTNSNVHESPSNPFLFSNGGVHKKLEISTPPPPPPPPPTTSINNPVAKCHKDYEPIWPESHNGNFVLASDESYINRVPLKPQTKPTFSLNYASSDKNTSGSSANRPQYYEKNQRSHSEERTMLHATTNSNPNLQPGFQSRFDDIKLLLEDLQAPHSVSRTQQMISSAPTTTRRDSEKGFHEQPGSSIPSVNLRHQSSLRTPIRPQIPQGLSCFNSKKPTSLESITDSFYYDAKNKNPSNGSNNILTQNGHMAKPSAGEHSRNSNEYVSVIQNRGNCEPTGFMDMFPRMEVHDRKLEDGCGIPVAPPRTKRLQQLNSKKLNNPPSASTSAIGRGDRISDSSCGVPPHWSNSDRGVGVERKNLPEVVRCSNYQEYSSEFIPNGQNNAAVRPTSPKHIIKALGIFQAKAANMRSKLGGWGEGREKKSLEKATANGTTPLTTDTDLQDDIDGGFGSSSSSSLYTVNPTNRSKPRHQYL